MNENGIVQIMSYSQESQGSKLSCTKEFHFSLIGKAVVLLQVGSSNLPSGINIIKTKFDVNKLIKLWL